MGKAANYFWVRSSESLEHETPMSDMTIEQYLQSEFPDAKVERELEPGSTAVFRITDTDRTYVLKIGVSFFKFPESEYVTRLEQFNAVYALKRSGELGVLVTNSAVTTLNTTLIGQRR